MPKSLDKIARGQIEKRDERAKQIVAETGCTFKQAKKRANQEAWEHEREQKRRKMRSKSMILRDLFNSHTRSDGAPLTVAEKLQIISHVVLNQQLNTRELVALLSEDSKLQGHYQPEKQLSLSATIDSVDSEEQLRKLEAWRLLRAKQAGGGGDDDEPGGGGGGDDDDDEPGGGGGSGAAAGGT